MGALSLRLSLSLSLSLDLELPPVRCCEATTRTVEELEGMEEGPMKEGGFGGGPCDEGEAGDA